jgi:hypothetical protein
MRWKVVALCISLAVAATELSKCKCSDPNSCEDDPDFKDAEDYPCNDWKSYNCSSYPGYKQSQLTAVQNNCPVSCELCTPDGDGGGGGSSAGIVLGVLGALLGLGFLIFLLRRPKKPEEKESYESLQQSLLEYDGLEMMESAPPVESGSKNAALSAPSPVWLKYVLTGAHITVKSEYGSSQTTGATVMNNEQFTVDQQVTLAHALPNGEDQVWLRLAPTNPPPLDHGWLFAKHPSTGADLCFPQEWSTAPVESQVFNTIDETGTTEAPTPAPATDLYAPFRERKLVAVENYGAISTETFDLEGTLTEEILLKQEELDERPGNVIVQAAVRAPATDLPPAEPCKVLVTGEASADINSIKAALERVAMEVREQYSSNHIAMEVTVNTFGPSGMKHLEGHLPTKELSQYHAIIVAFNASNAFINIAGATAQFSGILDYLRTFGIPEISLYAVATGDRDAKSVLPTDNFVLGTSMGGDYDLTQSNALGAGLASSDELLSEGLKQRLGPMQLRLVQDFIAAARFLSWNEQPNPAQRKLLRRHMRYLGHHKPVRRFDTNPFRCGDCKSDFTLAEVKDMGLAGIGVTLCTSCSRGHCSECGHQMAMSGECDCGAVAITAEMLVSSSARTAAEELKQTRLRAIAAGKPASSARKKALAANGKMRGAISFERTGSKLRPSEPVAQWPVERL